MSEHLSIDEIDDIELPGALLRLDDLDSSGFI